MKAYDFRKYTSNYSTRTKEKNEEILIISDFDKSNNNIINDNQYNANTDENKFNDFNETKNKKSENSDDNKPLTIFSLLNQPITVVPSSQGVEQANTENNFQIAHHQLDVTDSFEANLLKQLKAEMEEMPKKKAIKPIVTKSKNSPIMFDNSNHSNTSDKLYNYEVITNSCDTESTTSVSITLVAPSV